MSPIIWVMVAWICPPQGGECHKVLQSPVIYYRKEDDCRAALKGQSYRGIVQRGGSVILTCAPSGRA